MSVKALLRQVRFNIFIKKEKDTNKALIILKEELSFDDFLYYLSIGPDEAPVFAGFGKISFSFKPDPITGKPSPLQHNINIPLGTCTWDSLKDGEIPTHLLLFPYGEKNPIDCAFTLERKCDCYISLNRPETTMVNSILYKASSEKIVFLANHSKFLLLEAAADHFNNRDSGKYYINSQHLSNHPKGAAFVTCTEEAFID